MSNSRTPGILLLGLGALIFAGTTNAMLPAELFWGGAATSTLGLILFMKANRKHLAQSEHQTAQKLRPTIHSKARQTPPRPPAGRPEQTAGQPERRPQRQPDRGVAESGVTKRHAVGEAVSSAGPREILDQDELVLYEVDDSSGLGGDEEFRVSTDVSFPLEVQEQDSLAEQIEKLRRLFEDGILSSEEFNAAKAKLLG
jgi:hypothetical protein